MRLNDGSAERFREKDEGKNVEGWITEGRIAKGWIAKDRIKSKNDTVSNGNLEDVSHSVFLS